jgi:NAD(P)H-dependent FMN reductase
MQDIVCISGTNRPDNYTIRALKIVIDELKKNSANPVLFDARDLSLAFPGHPETEDAQQLRTAVEKAVGIVIATPEYHGSFCAMTKLIIENLGFPSALAEKPIALLGVAAGRIGAIKSLEQLKGICSHIGAIVVPGSVSIAGVQNLFDENGNCKDEATEAILRRSAHSIIGFLKEYVCPKHALEEMVRVQAKSWSTNV